MLLPEWNRLKEFIHAELRTTANRSGRLWPMPVAAALSSGLPLLAGIHFEHMDYGLISALGGLVFLYLQETALYQRMIWLMVSAFGMIACYALGIMSHQIPLLMVPVLSFTTMLVSMGCRLYRVGPPGSLFFVMAASIGAYTPSAISLIPLKIGLLTLGTLLACLIAFFYSVYTLRLQPPRPAEPFALPTFDFVVFDSVVIGLFVGLAMALAQSLHLEKAYWVPVSCLAVMQGTSMRALWGRQLQRILGTLIGLSIAWGLLILPMNKWSIPLVTMLLTFLIETTVVRNFGFAVIFITPLTIFLAEAATFGHGALATLLQARFFDTVFGSLVGLAGGLCLNSPRFREVAAKQLRRWIPRRLKK